MKKYIKSTTLFILFLLLTSSISTFAATKYWIGTGAAVWGNGANWSTSSGGGGGAGAPGSGDVATFDANGGNCNISTSATPGTLTVTSGYAGTISQNAGISIASGGASLSGGTFTGGGAGITCAGHFTISGMAFTSTSGTLTIGGNFTLSSGSFTHNSGTTLFAVSKTITGSITFYNLTLGTPSGGAATHTVASGTVLTVAHTLTLSTTNALTINTGEIDAQGDITINNTATGGGGSALIKINGTGSQTLTGSGTAGAGKLCKVEVDKSAGTLTLASIISVDNDWTYTTGTVSSGSGTPTVATCSSLNLDCQGSGGTMSFFNLTVYGGTTTLTGNVGITNNFTINNSTTLSGSSYTINLSGQWTNNGTFTYSTSTVQLQGTALQTINTSSSNETFYNLTVNKTSGRVLLNDPLIINNAVTFTEGIIKATGSNYFKLIDNATATAGNDSAFVYGYYKKVGDEAFTFALGDTSVSVGGYHPLSIGAPSSATDAYTAQYFNSAQTNGTTRDSILNYTSTCEYWNLARDAGSSNVTVKLGWNMTSCNIDSLTDLRVAYWNGSKWKDKGGSYTGNTTIGDVVTSSAQSSFGDFIIAKKYPKANAGADVTIMCDGDSTNLSGSTGTSYLWTPSTGLSCTNCYNPVAFPSSTTTYLYTVTYPSGYQSSDTLTINIPMNSGLHADTICTPITYNLADTVKWFSFDTDSINNSIAISAPSNPTFSGVLRASIFSGNCNNLTQLLQVTALDSVSEILFDSITLTPNTTYYLKIAQYTNTSCTTSATNISDFDMCMKINSQMMIPPYEHRLVVNGFPLTPMLQFVDAEDNNFPCNGPNDTLMCFPGIQTYATVAICDTICIQYLNAFTAGSPSFGKLFCTGAGGPQFYTDVNYPDGGIFQYCVNYPTPGVYHLYLAHYGLYHNLACPPLAVMDTVVQSLSHFVITVLSNPNSTVGITPLFQTPSCSISDFAVKVTGNLNAINSVEVHDVNYWISTLDNILPVVPSDSILHIIDAFNPPSSCRAIGPDTIFVRLRGQCNLDTTFKIPFFIEPLQPNFSTNSPVCFGNDVYFTNLTDCDTNVTSWAWDFGDGTFDSIQNPPPHTFPADGNYNVKLTILDCIGTPSDTTIQITILPLPPPPIITTTDYTVCSGSGTFCVPTGYVSYNWATISPATVSGSNTGNCVNINFNGATNGDVHVDVIDSNGCAISANYHIAECCSFDTAVYNSAINLTNGGNASAIFAGFPTVSISGITYVDVKDIKISINGTLTIDTNVTFRGCELLMGRNAKIQMDSARVLYLTTGVSLPLPTYIHACDYLWDGIYVDQPNDFIHSDKYTTTEDAENGVVITNNNKYSFLSAIFNKNHRSIFLYNYTSLPTPAIISGCIFESAPGVVSGKTFEITSGSRTLRYPREYEIGEVGVEIIANTVTPVIGGGAGGVVTNYFEYLIRGVNTINANFKATNNVFSNIYNWSYSTQWSSSITSAAINSFGGFTPHKATIGSVSAGEQNTFVNCSNGILLNTRMIGKIYKNTFDTIGNKGIFIQYSLSDTNMIYENTMNVVPLGIHCYKNKSITYVDRNDITTNKSYLNYGVWLQELSGLNTNGKYFVRLNTLDSVHYGIKAENLYKPFIDNNVINVKKVTSWRTARGIDVSACYNDTIQDNTITGVPNVTDTLVGGVYASLSPGSFIRCNITQNMGYGIKCAGTMAGTNIFNNQIKDDYYGFWLSNNGFIGLQTYSGDATRGSYNKWTGTFGSGYRTYVSDNTYGPSSSFKYRSSVASFVPNPNGTDGPSQNFTHTSTGNGSTSSPSCPFSLVSGPVLFPNAQLMAKDSIFFYGGDSIAALWLTRQNLYTNIMSESITVSGSTDIQNFVDTMAIHNPGKIYDAYEALRIDSFADVQTIISGITPENNIETSHLLILEICSTNGLNGDSVLSDAQITDLRTLAYHCPYVYGVAVYQARALLSSLDTIGVEYFNDCEDSYIGSGAGSKKAWTKEQNKGQNKEQSFIPELTKSPENFVIQVYPNPANDELMINIQTQVTVLNASIEFFNLMGEKINTEKLGSGFNKLALGNNFPSGVYLYRLVVNDQATSMDKLVIVK